MFARINLIDVGSAGQLPPPWMVKKCPAHGSFASQHECVFLKKGYTGRAIDQIRQVYKIDLKAG
jgi:hypothetical protein